MGEGLDKYEYRSYDDEVFDLAGYFANCFSIPDIRCAMIPCYKVFKGLAYGTANTAVKQSLALAVADVLSSCELDTFERKQCTNKNTAYSLWIETSDSGCHLEPHKSTEQSPQKMRPKWMNECSFVKNHAEYSKSATSYYQMLGVTLVDTIGYYEVEKYSHGQETAPIITFRCFAEDENVRTEFFNVLKQKLMDIFDTQMNYEFSFSPGDQMLLQMMLHSGWVSNGSTSDLNFHAQFKKAIRLDVDKNRFLISLSDARRPQTQVEETPETDKGKDWPVPPSGKSLPAMGFVKIKKKETRTSCTCTENHGTTTEGEGITHRETSFCFKDKLFGDWNLCESGIRAQQNAMKATLCDLLAGKYLNLKNGHNDQTEPEIKTEMKRIETMWYCINHRGRIVPPPEIAWRNGGNEMADELTDDEFCPPEGELV